MLGLFLIDARLRNTLSTGPSGRHLGKLVHGHVSRHANVETGRISRPRHYHRLHAHLTLRHGSGCLLLRLELGGRLPLGGHVLGGGVEWSGVGEGEGEGEDKGTEERGERKRGGGREGGGGAEEADH